MSWPGGLAVNAASSFLRHIPAANLSLATIVTYMQSITRLAEFLAAKGMPTDVDNIRREPLEAVLDDEFVQGRGTGRHYRATRRAIGCVHRRIGTRRDGARRRSIDCVRQLADDQALIGV